MKKGYILTLDVTVAAFISLLVISYITVERNKIESNPLVEEQMLIHGQGVVEALYHSKKLHTFNAVEINDSMSSMLAPQYNMRIIIESYTYDDPDFDLAQTVVVGDSPHDADVIVAGQTTFLTFSGSDVEYYNKVTYWVWTR